jgi:phosphoglycerol transferase MdoB-like AlkP superfamily enzyme
MLSYLPWLLSGSLVVWIALALLAPSVLAIITPFIKYGLDALAEYVRTLWEGFKYVFDRSSAVVFVLSAVVLAYWYGHVDHPKHKITKKFSHSVESLTKPTKKVDTDGPKWGWAN